MLQVKQKEKNMKKCKQKWYSSCNYCSDHHVENYPMNEYNILNQQISRTSPYKPFYSCSHFDGTKNAIKLGARHVIIVKHTVNVPINLQPKHQMKPLSRYS